MSAAQEPELHYPVLTPFKLGPTIVKPPRFLPLSAGTAAPYLAAGVLGQGQRLEPQAEAAEPEQSETPSPEATSAPARRRGRG